MSASFQSVFLLIVTVLLAACGTPAPGHSTDAGPGGGQPSHSTDAGANSGQPCTNLCPQRATCDAGATTCISGTVYAPGHADTATWGTPDPIYNALVYIPNAPVQPFSPGVTCDQCGANVSGSPLVTAQTGPDGRFQLCNVPVGANIPLVIQLGRWRRQVTIPNVSACADNPLPADLTRLPRNHTEGDIPLMAMVTGKVDVLECVLRKIGIDDSEFSVPAAQRGSGRVRFYIANGANYNALSGTSAPNESQLWGAGGDLSQYDMVLFACEGSRQIETLADQQRVIEYANAGGRVFATHYSYVWLTNDPLPTPVPFSQTAEWQVNQGALDSVLASIDTSFPKGMAFAQWLMNVGASSTFGQMTVNVVRHDFNAVNPPAQRWMYTSSQPLHYTFNTPIAYPPVAPVPPSMQCGRVLYSDFHVEDVEDASRFVFPAECNAGPLTAQERVLEFMLFDLASCVTPDSTSTSPGPSPAPS